MNVSIKGNERVTKLLNDWYQAMLQQQILKATNLKQEIEEQINILKTEENEKYQDQNLLLYYSLLDFRYKVLTDGLSITKNSFDIIETHNAPSDDFLSYYYNFFKAIHATLITNYNEASEYYEKAEKLLKYVPDEIERAEFYYRISTFYNYTYQPLKVINYSNKALDIFNQHIGYETNIALCKNLLGGVCIHLKQYEQAEEYFTSAIDILRTQGEETLILRVRNNIGWLYASQNLSTLAIRHLSEIVEKLPNHYKAILLLGREYFKLGETEKAAELARQGSIICNTLDDKVYKHHFAILCEMNHNSSTEKIEEVILEGIAYFDKEQLYEYTQEYAEKLALRFYEEDNHLKASKYFHLYHQAKQKTFEKGALK
ncbi:tetratricopeptide repeat protein [Bacillus sp. NPDC077411]|uniref:response regulator aspartate phosphatase n=1 Tax=Bacillus sp. NPDC077411 TaxID=3363947 RepID=UPI0037CB9821